MLSHSLKAKTTPRLLDCEVPTGQYQKYLGKKTNQNLQLWGNSLQTKNSNRKALPRELKTSPFTAMCVTYLENITVSAAELAKAQDSQSGLLTEAAQGEGASCTYTQTGG